MTQLALSTGAAPFKNLFCGYLNCRFVWETGKGLKRSERGKIFKDALACLSGFPEFGCVFEKRKGKGLNGKSVALEFFSQKRQPRFSQTDKTRIGDASFEPDSIRPRNVFLTYDFISRNCPFGISPAYVSHLFLCS